MVSAIFVYWRLVIYLHRALDAGPMVLILTSLVGILTFGLGDGGGEDGVSAYSVFNRGFQRILGSVDVEALVAQHVGGGMAALAPQQMQVGQGDEDHVRDAVAREGEVAEERRDGGANDGRARPNNNNRARRTGKKARRQDLEVRREMRRQRQAAAAMGLAGDGGEADMVAMNRLVEHQAIGGIGQDDVDIDDLRGEWGDHEEFDDEGAQD